MNSWRCRYRDTSLGGWLPWMFQSDLTGETYQCTQFADADNPPKLPRMNYVDPSEADYGDSPSGPNAPVITTGNERNEARDNLTGMTPKKNKPANGSDCCPDGEANCWRCWLRDHWIGLALLALSLAAFLTRKK